MGEGNSGVNLTYDSLFEIVLREKNREELQPLESSFFKDLVTYCANKKAIFESKVDDGSYSRQLANIKVLIRDLYECRERKVVRMALVSSKSKSDIVDLSGLLGEEKLFFDELVKVLDSFRGKVMDRLVQGKLPVISFRADEKPMNILDSVEKSETSTPTNIVDPDEKPPEDVKMVRFLSDTDVVLDSELNSYGPFKVSDEANVPSEIANILVTNGKAEIV